MGFVPARLWPFVACNRPTCAAGNRACRRPFRPPSNLIRLLTQFAGIFSGFVSCRHLAAKPEKFVAYREGGLKGRLQARLPATRKAHAEMALRATRGMKTRRSITNRPPDAIRAHMRSRQQEVFDHKLKHVPRRRDKWQEPTTRME